MNGPLAGLTVLVTGTVEGFSRDGANDAVRALGGTPVASVSGKTGLVVVGEGAGVSKMSKVRTHGLTVLTGEDFAALAADPGSWDGHPVGEPITAFDARHAEPEPEPDPYAGIPMAQRHLIGTATCYPLVDGVVHRQVRRSCQCGHKWLAASIHEPSRCPVETGTATLNTDAPWLRPAPASAPVEQPAEQPVSAPAPVEPVLGAGGEVPVDPNDLVDFDFDEPAVTGDW